MMVEIFKPLNLNQQVQHVLRQLHVRKQRRDHLHQHGLRQQDQQLQHDRRVRVQRQHRDQQVHHALRQLQDQHQHHVQLHGQVEVEVEDNVVYIIDI